MPPLLLGILAGGLCALAGVGLGAYIASRRAHVVHFNGVTVAPTSAEMTETVVAQLDRIRRSTGGVNMSRAAALDRLVPPKP